MQQLQAAYTTARLRMVVVRKKIRILFFLLFHFFFKRHESAKIKFFQHFFCSPTANERRRILERDIVMVSKFSQPFTDSPLRDGRSVEGTGRLLAATIGVAICEQRSPTTRLLGRPESLRLAPRMARTVRGEGAEGKCEPTTTARAHDRGCVTTQRSSASMGGTAHD